MPIPGYAHIALLAPRDNVAYQRQPSTDDLRVCTEAQGLIQTLLEVAAGLRPPSQLDNDSFRKSVRLHIRACLRARNFQMGSAQLMSVHAQASGEFHGLADLDGKRHAFTGVYADQALLAFRLL